MPMYAAGDHVKVEFRDERSGESEWMWVEVDHSDDERRLIFGRLDNQPVVHINLRIGQELAISYGKIRDRKRFIAS